MTLWALRSGHCGIRPWAQSLKVTIEWVPEHVYALMGCNPSRKIKNPLSEAVPRPGDDLYTAWLSEAATERRELAEHLLTMRADGDWMIATVFADRHLRILTDFDETILEVLAQPEALESREIMRKHCSRWHKKALRG